MKAWRLLALGLVSLPAVAAVDVDRTLDAASDGTVSVSNVSGSVAIKGWSRNQVQVTGTLGDRVEELVFERDGNEIIVHVKVPRNGSGRIESNLVISVPERSDLEVDTVSADIDVQGVHGDQELGAVSGGIRTAGFGADIDLSTVSGNIDVTGNNEEGRSSISSVSGSIDVGGLAGEIALDAVNGAIDVTSGRFERVQLETVNGSIDFRAALDGDARMDVETINGSVDLEFTGDVSARFDVETFNGSIRNCFGPEPVRTSRYTPGRELKFTEGQGDARVTIKTLNGGVRICK